jgi:hypothetical protein
MVLFNNLPQRKQNLFDLQVVGWVNMLRIIETTAWIAGNIKSQ